MLRLMWRCFDVSFDVSMLHTRHCTHKGRVPWFLLAASPVLSFVIYLIYKDDSDASNQRLMRRAVALAKARTGLKPQNYLGKMEARPCDHVQDA